MGLLQRLLEQQLSDRPYLAFTELIETKLEAQGISLSPRERERLQSIFRSETDDAGKFRLRRWKWWDKQDVSIEITEEELQQFKTDFSSFLENGLQEVIDEVSADVAETILGTLRKTWRQEKRKQDTEIRRFRSRLGRRWEPALSLLRMFVTISRELGEEVSTSYFESEDQGRPTLMDVQARLHARACQVSEEIVCLLGAGFADGAMARWRTLHEIAVVGLLLSHHGEALAKRYVAHEVVESRKAAREYQKHCGTLGFEPVTPEEFSELEQQYEDAVGRYGQEFKAPYGWAAGFAHRSNPSFADIERAAGIEHLRSYYKLASHQVHSNPKGVFFKMGLMDETDVLLAGPSDFGLADPGQSTAVSLAQVTASLITVAPTLDGIVGVKILTVLTTEVCDLFAQVQLQYERGERSAPRLNNK